MARTTYPVSLISTVSGHHKNTLARASTSNRHITKLEQSTFLRYLWVYLRQDRNFKTHAVNACTNMIGQK